MELHRRFCRAQSFSLLSFAQVVEAWKGWRNPLASLKALELRHRNIDIFLYTFSDTRKYANEQDLQPSERWKQRDLVNFFSLGVRLVCGGQYRML